MMVSLEKRHALWKIRDEEFLKQYSEGIQNVIEWFLGNFNRYLQVRIEELL